MNSFRNFIMQWFGAVQSDNNNKSETNNNLEQINNIICEYTVDELKEIIRLGKQKQQEQINKRYIDCASHAIGLDYKRPYIRHGKKFYKPYRNYYDTVSTHKIWNGLEQREYAVSYDRKVIDGIEYATFQLTRKGLDWLGEELDITILAGD